MSKKMRVILSGLAAVMVLTLGGAAAVLAQEGENTAPDEVTVTGTGFLSRMGNDGLLAEVAGILDIPEADLQAAWQQVHEEMRQAKLAGDPLIGYDGLLAEVAGILGISEADLQAAFQQARQELAQLKWAEAFQQALNRALEEGLITQEEADEIREWRAQKPEALDAGLFRRLFRFNGQPDRPKPGVRLGQRPEIRPQPGLQLNGEKAAQFREWMQNRPESSNGRSARARLFNLRRGQLRTGNQGNGNGQLPFQIEE